MADPEEARTDETLFAELRAADLGRLLSTVVFDVDGAARYLSVARNSVEYAAYRKRIPFVQMHGKKLFCKADLDDYIANRGRGRDSKLHDVQPVRVEHEHGPATPSSQGV